MQDYNKTNQSRSTLSQSTTPSQSNMMFVTPLPTENNVYPLSQHLLHTASTLGQYNGNYISNINNIYIPELYNSSNSIPNYTQHYSLPSIYDSKYSADFIPKINEKQENQYYDGNSHVEYKDEFIYQMPRSLLNPYTNPSQYTFF